MTRAEMESARWGVQAVDALMRGDQKTARKCFVRAHEVLADAEFEREAIGRLVPPPSPLVRFDDRVQGAAS